MFSVLSRQAFPLESRTSAVLVQGLPRHFRAAASCRAMAEGEREE